MEIDYFRDKRGTGEGMPRRSSAAGSRNEIGLSRKIVALIVGGIHGRRGPEHVGPRHYSCMQLKKIALDTMNRAVAG